MDEIQFSGKSPRLGFDGREPPSLLSAPRPEKAAPINNNKDFQEKKRKNPKFIEKRGSKVEKEVID